MDWLTENWLWIVVGAAFVWMHLKMHGGHGGHGARDGRGAHGGHGGGGGCCGGHGGHDRASAAPERVSGDRRPSPGGGS